MVRNTDAGLASALLNVGQQVGGALGLSVITTVFGTSARNFVSGHSATLQQQLMQATHGNTQLAGAIGQKVGSAGQNGLQPADIHDFVQTLPVSQRADALAFFNGPYRDFSHHLVAHASGQGFLMGAVFGVVAIVAAVVLIKVKKEEVPAEDASEAAVVG
jgi:hypothetical protein